MASKKTDGPDWSRTGGVFDPDMVKQIEYHAAKKGVNKTEFIRLSTIFYVGYLNGDFQYPELEAARLNQMVELLVGMKVNLEELLKISTMIYSQLVSQKNNLIVNKGDVDE